MITLYDFEMSGNCYKVRLLLRLLDLPHQLHAIDFYPGREHRSAWFLKLNPLGQLPVLTDEALTLCDSQAILVYLASRYDSSGRWYPRTPDLLGQITQWLLFADGLGGVVSAARFCEGMFYPGDVAEYRARAHALLRILDRQLFFSERCADGWVCDGTQPTIADLACFPFVILSEEAGILRRDYAALRRWGDRVRELPHFIPMSGIFGLTAA
jgi:glutathione S-transferase